MEPTRPAPATAVNLDGSRILVAGCTGQVGFVVARELARRCRVHGLARFGDAASRARLEEVGVEPVAADLADSDLGHLPDDLDYVLNFAVVKSGDFAYDMRANAEGAGRLMSRCRRVRAFLHCSTTGVYQEAGHTPLAEDAPLGDNHRAMLPTYSLAKIAAESVVRFAARELDLPTTIARLGVPYGAGGGWPAIHLIMMQRGLPIPVSHDQPSLYSPIHEDDILATLPGLLSRAAVPASTYNWTGLETVGIEEWCRYLGELTGLEPKFEVTDRTIRSVVADSSRLARDVGAPRLPWREGMRRMVEARHPELLRP